MFSFVIPVLNEAGQISRLLSTLRRDFPASELIVVDGGSVDQTVSQALPLADSVLLGAVGRARQMNLGAACAQGEWLCFLHADTRPLFDTSMLVDTLNEGADWGFCRVQLEGKPRALRMISWCMNQRSGLTRVATGDQLLIVRRALFEAVGGFADIPLMEDVELSKRLRRQGNPTQLALEVRSSGRRWEEQGVIATVLRMWFLRFAFFLGVSPRRLWHHYYGAQALRSSAADG